MTEDDSSGDDSSDQASRNARPGDKASQSKPGPAGPEGSRKASPANDEVGRILRGAYRDAVDEPIPDDLMNLLNKLE